jgi:hypothetical protein
MINKDLASPSLFRFHVHRLVALCFVDPEVMMFRRSAQTQRKVLVLYRKSSDMSQLDTKKSC